MSKLHRNFVHTKHQRKQERKTGQWDYCDDEYDSDLDYCVFNLRGKSIFSECKFAFFEVAILAILNFRISGVSEMNFVSDCPETMEHSICDDFGNVL